MYEQNQVLREVQQERDSQDKKWGVQNHDAFTWLSILGEEVGEAHQAALENRFGTASGAQYREELVQVAAVAVAMIECYDRHHAETNRVYLAGPIKGCQEDKIFEWRNHAASALIYPTLDPAAARNFAHKESSQPLNEIVNPDKHDIDASAVLLAYCWQVSVGTSMEILYAWERGKYVVVVIPNTETASAWIIAHAHAIFHDLDEAIKHINEL